MSTIDIGHRATITHDVSLESPLVAQYIRKQELTTWCTFAINTVVCSHDDFHLAFFNQHLECRKIGFPQIAFRRFHVHRMARGFWSWVNGIVFTASSSFQIDGIITLYSLYESRSHRTRKIWVFTVCLHSPTPTWIPEDVYVRTPKCQARITCVILVLSRNDVLGTSFRCNGVSYLFHQVGVKCSSHTNRLRKDRCPTASCHPMKSLVPPIVWFYSQPTDTWGFVHHLREFLFQRHLFDDVCCLLLKLAQGFLGRCRYCCSQHSQKNKSFHNYSVYIFITLIVWLQKYT